ncbi:MAG: hypothetical protein ACRCVG_05190 [Methanobacteriaceae archaeon]
MSNDTISIAIILFCKGAGSYQREITSDTKKDIPQHKEDEFWDFINKFSEPVLHILKGAVVKDWDRNMQNNSDDEKVKVYLGNLERIAYAKKGPTKDVWIWSSNLRSLAKIYGIDL